MISLGELITDIWFRSERSLVDLASDLGLSDVVHDAENHWEWVTGWLDDVQLDITRTHRKPALDVDTRIFRPTRGAFDARLKALVLDALRPVVAGTIRCGRWTYVSGEEFELVVVEAFPQPADDGN